MSKVFSFLKDESGATAIEYGLIAAGISVVIITAVKSVGSNLSTTFDSIASATPARRLLRNIRAHYVVNKLFPIVLHPFVTVSGGDLSGVIAVVAVDLLAKVAYSLIFQLQPCGYVRVNVPAEQHVLIKSVILK